MAKMFYQGKRVLVTGGGGFVGRHIVDELLKEGAHVRVPIHQQPLIIKDSRIETLHADLAKQEDCRMVLEGMDYCFHAAGAVTAVSATVGKVMEAITTNLTLTAQMLQAAWAVGIERFLLFSSSTGYPEADHPVKEEEFWGGSIHSAYFGYGWMRRYLERIAEFVASESEVKIAIVRPTAVYGRQDNSSHVIPSLIRKAIEKTTPYEVWGTGEEMRDFLHVQDLARACLLITEKYATCDALNIGYGKAVKIKEIVPVILKAAGHKDARIIFNSSRPTAISSRAVDTSKAMKILGFEPKISLEEGLRDTVEYYINKLGKK